MNCEDNYFCKLFQKAIAIKAAAAANKKAS
jgi:hypothetical protein